MRTRIALIAIACTCFAVGEAEAKFRGGGFLKGSSRSAAVPTRAAAEPRVGVGAGIIVPIGSGGSRSESARKPQEDGRMPLPPRPVEDEAPKLRSASAGGEAAPKIQPAAPRPWCANAEGGREGTGLCVVGLKPELAGAPALLAFN